MDRWYTIRVVAVAAAAWAFAIAAAIFHAPHSVIIIASNVASTASVWVIARHSVTRIKHDVVAHTSTDVHKFGR
jgi:hypothetical protein